MAPMLVTLNDLERHSSVAGLFTCDSSAIYAAFYQISTDSVLARSLCVSLASCLSWITVFEMSKQSTLSHSLASSLLSNFTTVRQ